MVRLKYKKLKDKDGYIYLQTEQILTSNLELIQGIIYPLINMYKIFDVFGKEISRGAANNLPQLKKEIKKDFIKLGVKFEDEIRNNLFNN